jgi:hypothetical protein
MKCKYTIAIFLSIVVLSLHAQSEFKYKLAEKKHYKSGERLVYSIKYGPVTGGTAEITFNKKNYKGQAAYHAKIFARTRGLANKIYKVRDTYESYMQLNDLMPIMAVQNLKEGDYRFYTEMHFDQENSTVYSMKSDSTYNIPAKAVDMVTLLYYIRAMNLEKIQKGQFIDINIFFDEEVLPFDFRYKGIETIKTSYGTFECHRFDPVVIVGREFKSEDDMKIYLSTDGNFVPIRVKFDLKVGSIKCDLIEHYNLVYPLTKK